MCVARWGTQYIPNLHMKWLSGLSICTLIKRLWVRSSGMTTLYTLNQLNLQAHTIIQMICLIYANEQTQSYAFYLIGGRLN